MVHDIQTTLDVHPNWVVLHIANILLERTHIKYYINFMKSINVIVQNVFF